MIIIYNYNINIKWNPVNCWKSLRAYITTTDLIKTYIFIKYKIYSIYFIVSNDKRECFKKNIGLGNQQPSILATG